MQVVLDRDLDDLVLSISDDGRGMAAPDHVGAGIGVRGMRYRAALIRGSLTIRARVPHGVIVEIRMRRDGTRDDAAPVGKGAM